MPVLKMARRRQRAARLVGWIGVISLTGCSAHVTPPEAEATPVPQAQTALPDWQPGFLDIHHIQTGRGNAAFVIFPDGTTMLIDAGALQDDWDQNERYRPLKLAPAVPDASRRPGEWIADYIGQFIPTSARGLDYALITHFHGDHYGALGADNPASAHGDWKLTGLTDVAERWPIKTLIDRDYPHYDFPRTLRGGNDPSFRNYLRFVDAGGKSGAMATERFEPGSKDQIVCRKKPDICSGFEVRNIAANGVVWTGDGNRARALLKADQIVNEDGRFNENPLSAVIRISYGDFDYVTGGDLTGVNEPDEPEWFAMERSIAPVVGEVDAVTLNHHGNRDATSAAWLRALTPRVLIQQTWVSDHPGGEVVARMISRKIWPDDRDIFATYVHPETQIAIGPWLSRNYEAVRGHLVIRIAPGGKSYATLVLDDLDPQRKILRTFGPYHSRE